MKLHKVPASTGILWVKLGIRTFFRQPLALAGLFFMFMLVVSVLSIIPLLGHALALALLPAATLGLMAATREAAAGQFPMPTVLASAFQAGKDRMRAMLVLGAIYAVGSFVIMGLTALIAGSGPVGFDPENVESAGELLRQPGVMRGIIVSLVLYVPLGLLFWHAPALVHWHGVSPAKSLFFSALACWTNKAALVVYFLGWTGVFFGVSLVLVLFATAFGGPQLLSLLLFPVAMLMSAMFFSSLYFTFRDSFTTDEGNTPA
ncbi:BPSS1780 family membrane protein [Tepidicella baoligensis]|uniref:BPSS1780 family membrane protein n=1 Tax=Tepidicella baoligensis TaxID=2707016 RepID=UPI0015D96F23|nr:BPSS1780 family membrane protein [Tepidicella baoligensis]